MVFKDSDFISKDKPELDFILHKWSKRVSQDNRLLLGTAIDRFRFDPENKPFTRERFYAWALSEAVPATLQDAADGSAGLTVAAGSTARGSADGNSGGAAGADGKPTFFGIPRLALIIAAAVILIILILLFFRGCGFSLNGGWGNPRAADSRLQGVAGEAGAFPETLAPVETVTQETAEADLERTVSISGLPREALIIYFEPDVSNSLTAAEDLKVIALISALRLFEAGSMTVTGHAAAVGYPEGERNVSELRSRFIAERLRSAGVPGTITLRTTGEGSMKMVSGSDIETARRLSRRIEITVP